MSDVIALVQMMEQSGHVEVSLKLLFKLVVNIHRVKS